METTIVTVPTFHRKNSNRWHGWVWGAKAQGKPVGKDVVHFSPGPLDLQNQWKMNVLMPKDMDYNPQKMKVWGFPVVVKPLLNMLLCWKGIMFWSSCWVLLQVFVHLLKMSIFWGVSFGFLRERPQNREKCDLRMAHVFQHMKLHHNDEKVLF